MRHTPTPLRSNKDHDSSTSVDGADAALRRLVVQAQGGDQDAFGEIYVQCQGRIRGFLLRRVSDPDVAEDIAQQVFLRAWQSLPRYQQTRAPFLAWLFRIARNALVDHYRKQRMTVELDGIEIADESDHDAGLIHSEEFAAVTAALATLSADYQEVIRLRFLGGLSAREVAAVMDRSEGAVRVLQLRALRALRATLNVVEDAA